MDSIDTKTMLRMEFRSGSRSTFTCLRDVPFADSDDLAAQRYCTEGFARSLVLRDTDGKLYDPANMGGHSSEEVLLGMVCRLACMGVASELADTYSSVAVK